MLIEISEDKNAGQNINFKIENILKFYKGGFHWIYMVDIGTSGGVLYKAGEGVNIIVSGAMLNQFIDDAEAAVCMVSREDWTTLYSGGIAKHQILREAVENLAASYAILYDLDSYPERIQAEDKINFLMYRFNQDISLLGDQKVVDFLKA